MEPAMLICAGVAAVTLTAGAFSSIPAAARCLATVRVPLPARSLAALLLFVSLAATFSRPRSASATMAPPVVRLGDRSMSSAGQGEPASIGSERSVAAAADRSVGSVPTRTGRTPSGAATYVVEPGDSLWRIAANTLRSRDGVDPTSADIARFWPTIYETNRDVIGDDPNLIVVGQQLMIPEG